MNDMQTIAKDIQCSWKAGLVLCGDDMGTPEYCGSGRAFNKFEEMLEWVDENGSYPWAPITLSVKHL